MFDVSGEHGVVYNYFISFYTLTRYLLKILFKPYIVLSLQTA